MSSSRNSRTGPDLLVLLVACPQRRLRVATHHAGSEHALPPRAAIRNGDALVFAATSGTPGEHRVPVLCPYDDRACAEFVRGRSRVAALDLPAYLRLLRDRWRLVAIPVIVGALLGVASWLVSDRLTDSASYYRAAHTVVFDPPPDATWAFQSLDEVALLATGGEVPASVGEQLGEDGDILARRTVTYSNVDTNTITISVVGQEAGDTERLANAVTDELVSTVTAEEQAGFAAERDQTSARLQSLTDELGRLDAQLVDATAPDRDVLLTQRTGTLNQYWFTYEQFQQLVAEGTPSPRLSTFSATGAVRINADDYHALIGLGTRGENNIRVDHESPAQLPTGSTSRDGALPRGLLGGFLGLLAGLGLALAFERMNRRLRSRDEVEAAFAVPVLAEVPRLAVGQQRAGEVVAVTSPLSRSAEAYRAVRSLLLLHAQGGAAEPNGESARTPEAEPVQPDGGLVVMVTSASPGEGKTTTTANLAAVFAEPGASVLAVNCDFHRPRLPLLLGTSGDSGKLTDTGIAGVRCVTAVTDDPTVAPPHTVALQRQVLLRARPRFDIVLVDTAPLLTTNDATELVAAVDLVVVVARAGMTTLGAAERARELLERLGASVPGVVLVDPNLGSVDRYYDTSVAVARRAAAAGTRPGAKRAPSARPDDDLAEAEAALFSMQ